MIDDRTIDKLIERLTNRIQLANNYFLSSIGESIKQIGELTPSKAQQLVQILKYGDNYQNIIKEISRLTKLNVKEIDKIFEEYAKQDQQFYKNFYKYRNIPFVEYAQNDALIRQTQTLSNISKGIMLNFTNSSALGYSIRDLEGNITFTGLRQTYERVLDTALLNVGQGKETFDDAMRNILKDIGGSGLKTLDYDSGRSIRLDSMIRMHLKDGLRNLHNENQKIIAEEIDADGVEISVHINPAPDHAEVQGRQFSNEEFDKFQNDIDAKDYTGKLFPAEFDGHDRRSISEYNCYHYIFSIVLGVNKPQYSDEELQQIINDNNKGFEIDGKHYTMYEGTQLQRMLERRMREQKDIQILAKKSGNEYLAGETQNKIRVLSNKYKELSDTSGLPTKMKRLRVGGYKKSAESTKAYTKQIDQYKVGEIDITKYTDQFNPSTNDIIFTPKQYKHIKDYKDRQETIDLIPEIIKNPDHIYIETKKKNTIWLTKKIDEKKSHKLVIKLNTTTLYQKKELGYKHSVITMHPIKTKTLEKYVGKRTIQIDKKD